MDRGDYLILPIFGAIGVWWALFPRTAIRVYRWCDPDTFSPYIQPRQIRIFGILVIALLIYALICVL
jgi:hypothetical protein